MLLEHRLSVATSSFSTSHLALMAWAKPTVRRVLIFSASYIRTVFEFTLFGADYCVLGSNQTGGHERKHSYHCILRIFVG